MHHHVHPESHEDMAYKCQKNYSINYQYSHTFAGVNALIFVLQVAGFDRLDKLSPCKRVKQGERSWSVPVLYLHHLLVLESPEILIA